MATSAALLLLAGVPSAWSAELWAVRAETREGREAIVVERSDSSGDTTYTLATAAEAALAVPAIALDGRGGAAAAWIDRGAGGSILRGAIFDGRTWSPPAALRHSSSWLGQPALAFDGAGGYWLALARESATGDDIELLRWRGGKVRAGGVFGASGVPDIEPALERTAGGGVTLSWLGFENGAYRRRERLLAAATGPEAGPPGTAVAAPRPVARASSSRGGYAWTDGARLFSAPLPQEGEEGWSDQAPPADAAAPAAAAASTLDLTRILGLGDSTTWGRGSMYEGPLTDYLTRLDNQLRGPWTFQNGGHPGATSTRLLSFADGELAWRPGLTLLVVGINDAYYQYSYGTTLYNVKALAQKILATGSKVVLATTTPVSDTKVAAQYQLLRDVVNPAIRQAAAETKVPLVELWNYFASLPNWRSYIHPVQDVHLVDAGYELVASRFRLLLQKNDLVLPATGTARGPLLGDVSLAIWDPLVQGAVTETGNAGAQRLVLDTVSPLADNGIVAASPIDLDGDGIDGIAVVRAALGSLSLVVYNAPPAGAAGQAILDAVTVQAQADWLDGVCACPDGQTRIRRSITHLFSIDQDGDGKDEFGLVCTRMCVTPGVSSTEKQVVEIWRANQPDLAPPQRLVMDQWRVPNGGWIHDISAIQADADPAQEILLLTQNPRVSTLHTLPAGNPDAIGLLETGRYGRMIDCASGEVPTTWRVCDRWRDRGKTQCGELEIRSLTPRAVVYDTPPAGADTQAENVQRQLYTFWFEDSPLLVAHCNDTGEEWTERSSDVIGIAAADVSRTPDNIDEALIVRMRAVDSIEAYKLPPLPSPSSVLPTRVALDRWVRTGQPHQYLIKSGSIPDGAGGAKKALLLWLNRRT